MKIIVFSLLATLLTLSAFAQHTKKDLVGKWEGADSQNTKASIQFLDTNKVIVFIGGNAMPPYTYTINLPKNPAKLDIAMLTPNGQTATLQGFLLFVDSNTIKWQIFPNGGRPGAYNENSPDGPVLTLKRVKQ
jgi:hypothetical protein